MQSFLLIVFSAAMLIVTSCNKEDDFSSAMDYIKDITGDYEGSYLIIDGTRGNELAKAEVRHLSGIEIEIHCYGDLLDTTFVLDIYANHDSMMLCPTGDNFETTYGHRKGDYHMKHHGNDNSEWMHHLDDDHEINDLHFGGFNLSNHSLGYSFKIEQNNTTEIIRFEGIRIK